MVCLIKIWNSRFPLFPLKSRGNTDGHGVIWEWEWEREIPRGMKWNGNQQSMYFVNLVNSVYFFPLFATIFLFWWIKIFKILTINVVNDPQMNSQDAVIYNGSAVCLIITTYLFVRVGLFCQQRIQMNHVMFSSWLWLLSRGTFTRRSKSTDIVIVIVQQYRCCCYCLALCCYKYIMPYELAMRMLRWPCDATIAKND